MVYLSASDEYAQEKRGKWNIKIIDWWNQTTATSGVFLEDVFFFGLDLCEDEAELGS